MKSITFFFQIPWIGFRFLFSLNFFWTLDWIVTYNCINQKAYLMNLHNLAAHFLKFKKNYIFIYLFVLIFPQIMFYFFYQSLCFPF